ncbi:DUF4331 family protein [Sorangium sp. So ce118]
MPLLRLLLGILVLGPLGGLPAVASDHLDGPRAIGDPAADLTDLYAFQSPERADHTVLIADVFPIAGDLAFFSDAVNYIIAVRRVRVAGSGNEARFQAAKEELQFSCKFGSLEASASCGKPRQRGACTLPGGRTLPLVVGDARGAATPDGVFRVFAGLRSDPFFSGWEWPPRNRMPKAIPNVLQDNNVLSIVIELDTTKVLEPRKGSLFGVIAKTTPRAPRGVFMGNVPRIDRVGRPEVTNLHMLIDGETDLRDLWNQEDPFAIAPKRLPLYRDRLLLSLDLWDRRDGKVDWTEAGRRALANVLLDDFLLIDVAKPTTDDSHREIEHSTLEGKKYATGGGRTLDANIMNIFISYEANRGRTPMLHGGAKSATQPGGKAFPYVQPPNVTPIEITRAVNLAAGSKEVWKVIGRFDGLMDWHPMVVQLETVGRGVGQLRKSFMTDGSEVVERLEELDDARRLMRYTMVSGLPASDYTGVIQVRDKGAGCTVEWRVSYRLKGAGTPFIEVTVNTMISKGLEGLKTRFGVLQ